MKNKTVSKFGAPFPQDALYCYCEVVRCVGVVLLSIFARTLDKPEGEFIQSFVFKGSETVTEALDLVDRLNAYLFEQKIQ